MRSWQVASSMLVAVLTQVSACGNLTDDALPAIRQPALFHEPQACVPAPQPPPLPPDERPSDPSACLSPNRDRPDLPVVLSIVNGSVVKFEFYDQCSGEEFTVAASVRACIGKSLATWRYAVWPTCPGQQSESMDYLYLKPLGGPHKAATLANERPCGASGGIG